VSPAASVVPLPSTVLCPGPALRLKRARSSKRMKRASRTYCPSLSWVRRQSISGRCPDGLRRTFAV
jgi:hypothetical protein